MPASTPTKILRNRIAEMALKSKKNENEMFLPDT